MQAFIGAAMAGIAFFIPTHFYVQASLACFWLMAFSSATHDISADGFYMLGLSEGEQSFFVGIRNTFYRFANIFGQGILVMIAGWIEQRSGNIPLAWSLVFYFMAGLFIALTLYHSYILPRLINDTKTEAINGKGLWENFLKTFISFFKKKHIGLMLFFLLTYRLGEAQLVKIASPFLLDASSAGGLGISTTSVGFIYGTIGVIGLLFGGIVSGILVSRHGFKRWLLPMALAINLPDLLYVWLATTMPSQEWIVATCVAIEQFGYGFGFTAYTLYLIYIADGPNKTAHYAIGTGLMSLGMMLPGMPAGWIQELIGYNWFFVWVCICTIPGIIAALMVKRILPEDFGKLTHKS
jgi:PAT family beta-lactamase induction signal transducer AmpG